MLSLTVRAGDYVTIGEDVVVQVVKAGEVCRLAIQAPKEMNIKRAKVLEQEGETPECIQKLRQSNKPVRPRGFKRTAD